MKFGEKIKQMVAKGFAEIGQEFGRLGVQGGAEFGSALFTGNAYVPYGQGQNRAGVVHGMEGLHGNEKEQVQQENEGRSQENDGRSM